jgi:bifunctional ADP-heptose synthase (sugar kinase/adenylyltransferase)
MNNNNSYLNIIEHFGSKTILVIGDLILDVYLKGKTARLCPEAPVPVVDIEEECVALGGAANTAILLFALSILCKTQL